MALQDLSEDERADLRKRLAILDLQDNAIFGDDLEVPSGRTVTLRMVGESPVTPLILQTGDLDKMRNWIGTPERAATKRALQPYEAILRANLRHINRASGPAEEVPDDGYVSNVGGLNDDRRIRALGLRRTRSLRNEATGDTRDLAAITGISGERLLAAVRSAAEGKRPSSGEMELLRGAARTYIHGDKRLAAPFKAAIEASFGSFEIAAWLFPKVVVKKNSTLFFGPGVHNLTASELVIEPGGRVVSHGHLKVNVRRLRRTTGLNVALPGHVLSGPLRPRTFP